MNTSNAPKPAHNKPRLYLITNDTDLPNEKKLINTVRIALNAGVQWVQFRTKPWDKTGAQANPNCPFPSFAERLNVAEQLQALCKEHGAHLFINDELALATACGANLHIGQSDGSLTAAKEQLPKDAWIGVTCHDRIDLAQQAHAQGANYVSFGAFFPSKTKPHARTASLEILKSTQQPPLPKVAIGGITLDNAPQVLAAGAQVLAVSHAILGAEDVAQACKGFLSILDDYT